MDTINLAKEFDGQEIYLKLTPEQKELCKAKGIVVVTGYSDDNVEFQGAIDDEVGAYGGAEIAINEYEILKECEDACDHCARQQSIENDPQKIIAKWNHEGFSWHIDATFDRFCIFTLYEDGEPHTRGIVFYLSAVK